MSKDTRYALLVIAVILVALGLAGSEDYRAQLVLDQALSVVVTSENQ